MTHPDKKSEIVQAVAEKLGLPVVDIKMSVPNQLAGLPIIGNEPEVKEEYQIRASSGRVVMSFSSRELLDKWSAAQFKTHKHNAARVHAFKVTTITEQL